MAEPVVPDTDCREFDIGPFAEFSGKADLSKVIKTVSGSPNELDCKQKCINDVDCAIWSRRGNLCDMYGIDTSKNMYSGLVIHPVYAYNSGFPNRVHDVITNTDQDACKQACKDDSNCQMFEFDKNINKCTMRTYSSPTPTGYVKLNRQCMNNMECIKGKEYYLNSRSFVYVFHATNNTVKIYKPITGGCPDVAYTLSNNNQWLTATDPSGTVHRFSMYTGNTVRLRLDSRQDYVTLRLNEGPTMIRAGCSPTPFTLPSPGTGTCPDIYECVRGKEYTGSYPLYNTVTPVSTDVVIRFEKDDKRLLFYAAGLAAGTSPCNLINYTISDDNRSLTFTVPLFDDSIADYKNTNVTIYDAKSGPPSITVFMDFRPNTVQEDPKEQFIINSSGTSLIPAGYCDRILGCASASEIEYCEDGSTRGANGICGDGNFVRCLDVCSDPDDVCPSPFRTTMKFMNEDDYSDRIIITPYNITFNNSRPHLYRVKNLTLNNQKLIITSVSVFIYEISNTDQGNKIHSLKTFDNKHIIYKDLRSYFYKKTFIKPVYGSSKTITNRKKNCINNVETDENVQESILYHCITFESFDVYRYTILKKSQVVAAHDVDSNFTYFEHLVKPLVMNVPPTGYGIWNVNTTNEILSYAGTPIPSLHFDTTVLEDYDYFDMTFRTLSTDNINRSIEYYSGVYGGSFWDNLDIHYTLNNLICYDPTSAQLRALRRNGFNSDNYMVIEFPNNDIRPNSLNHPIIQLTRKDTNQAVILELVTFDTAGLPQDEITQSNMWRRAIVNILNFNGNVISVDRSNFSFYERSFSDPRTSIRVSYLRRRTIPQDSSMSLIINPENGNIGDFFRYDCQLLSGIQGYNRCSTKLLNLQSAYQPVYCENLDEAANKCDLCEWCIGFEYNTTTKQAIFLRGDQELMNTNTNRNEHVISSRSDGIDTVLGVNYVISFATGSMTVYIKSIRLFHNIFPCEKVSPITDTQQPESTTVTSNESVTGVLKSPYINQPGRPESTHAFNNTTSNTKIVYLKSNIPNIFGETFIGIHHKRRLPKSYSGSIGRTSIPREITVTNTIIIDGIQQSNRLLKIYRLTQNNPDDMFLVTTQDDRFIKNDFTTSDAVGDGQEFVWNIVSFVDYETKLFLVSVLDKNIVLELDLTVNFVFPQAFVENTPILLDLNDGDDTCSIRINGTSMSCYYTYTGNDLVLYDKACNTDDGTENTEIVRRFRFYGTECELYDLDSGLKLEPTQSTLRGSFIHTGVVTQAAVYNEPDYDESDPISDAWQLANPMRLAVMGGLLPPAVLGDMDAKANGLWFGLFFASFIPVGRIVGPIMTGTSWLLKLPAIALRFPKLGFRFRLPRFRTGGQIPDTPISSGRVVFPPEGPIIQSRGFVLPPNNAIARTMPKIPATPIEGGRYMQKIPATPIGGSPTPAPARPAAGATGGRPPTKQDAIKFAKETSDASNSKLAPRPATGVETYYAEGNALIGRGFNRLTFSQTTSEARTALNVDQFTKLGL